MKTQIRLILSTLGLTVLIWTYADRTGHGSTPILVPVAITLAEPGGPLVLRIVDAPKDEPNVKQINMELRGPNRAIALLQSEHEYGEFRVTVKIADELGLGRHSRNLFSDLSDAPEILDRGLTLERITPEAVEFVVDRYKTVTVPLGAIAGSFEDDLVDGTPVITPQTVHARVLESKLGEGFSLPPLLLSLQEAITEELKKHPEGVESPITFPVSLASSWPGIEATFEPGTVQVTIKLKRDSVTERITVRPLRVMVTQDFFDGSYEIEWDPEQRGAQLVQDIDVKVPISQRDRLEELERDTHAFVVIDDDDLPREQPAVTGTRPAAAVAEPYKPWSVYFRFPPGFEHVTLKGSPPTVKFRVTKAGPSELTGP